MSKLYLPTIDPRNGGGVFSVLDFTASAANSAGILPLPCYNSYSWDDSITIKDLLLFNMNDLIEHESIHDISGIRLNRIFPESEAISYISNFKSWTSILENADGIFGVGGTCLPCLPAALSGKKYSCWVGTLLDDERSVQVSQFGYARRYRYALERPILSLYEKYILDHSETVYVQSTYTANMIKADRGIPASKLSLLPFPIDTEKYRPIADVQGGTNHSEDSLLFIGRTSDPRKDLKTLFEAISIIANSNDDIHLIIVGDCLTKQQVQLVKKYGISENITCEGKVEDVTPFLHRASVLVLPSRQEGLGIVGLEALSCGVPVVSTRCGGPEDYVLDGENGYLVPVGDARKLATALNNLIDDDLLRTRFSKNGRTFVEENYSERKLEPLVENILTDCLN